MARAEPADLIHVRQAVHCASKTRNGGECAAMTNYRCQHCDKGFCGRHALNHWCASAVTRS